MPLAIAAVIKLLLLVLKIENACLQLSDPAGTVLGRDAALGACAMSCCTDGNSNSALATAVGPNSQQDEAGYVSKFQLG